MQALELFDDVPHTEHAVTLFNQDFRHAGQTDDLTIFQAEYALKAPDLECLHCLLADQLVGEEKSHVKIINSESSVIKKNHNSKVTPRGHG